MSASQRDKFVIALMRRFIRYGVRPFFGRPFPIWFQRKFMAVTSVTAKVATGTHYEPGQAKGIEFECWRSKNANDNNRAIVYFHGGAYCLGSPKTHRAITSHLALYADCPVFALKYRLAPEHPYPAAIDDAVSMYEYLLESGYRAKSIRFCGDSAGGGLALATALRLMQAQQPLPGRLSVISPWVDLTGKHYNQVNDNVDILLKNRTLAKDAQNYTAGVAANSPLVSPLFADVSGLPPTQILVGSEEILYPEAQALAKKMGAKATLICFEGMWHVFPLQAGLFQLANDAIRQMADFLTKEDQLSR